MSDGAWRFAYAPYGQGMVRDWVGRAGTVGIGRIFRLLGRAVAEDDKKKI